MGTEWILILFGALLVGGGLFGAAYYTRQAAAQTRQKHDSLAESNMSIDRFYDQSGEMLQNPPLATLSSAAKSTDPKLAGNIQTLLDYYDPHRGRLTSWWQKGKAESRNQLLTVLNEEQRLVIERGAILEKQVLEGKKTQSDFQLYVSQNAAVLKEISYREALIDKALAKNMTVETDDALTREGGMSAIRIKEHEEKERINLNTKLAEKQETLRLALIAKNLSEMQKIHLIQGQIDAIYKEMDEIENNKSFSERTIRRMLEDRDLIIETLQKDRNARQAGLLATHKQRELRGNDEDTNLR